MKNALLKNGFILCLTGVFGLAAALSASAANWPGWRGPDGTGVSSEKSLPLRWSANENVRWRAELPGRGNSTPIVWGNRVFLSQAVEKENRRTLMCFDRTTGKLLWQSGVSYAEPEPTSDNNPYCAGSPATDGERLYVCFGSAGAHAYDFEGKEVWHRDLGKLNHMFGNAVLLGRTTTILCEGIGFREFGLQKEPIAHFWGMFFPSWEPPSRRGFGRIDDS